MSLERKDVRFKLHADMHEAMRACAEAEADGEIAQWCERIICRAVRERVHAATVIATQAARSGITGITREDSSGFAPLES